MKPHCLTRVVQDEPAQAGEGSIEVGPLGRDEIPIGRYLDSHPGFLPAIVHCLQAMANSNRHCVSPDAEMSPSDDQRHPTAADLHLIFLIHLGNVLLLVGTGDG